MSYVGNVPTTAAFPFDQFSGNGSTTAFTLSYAPAGATSIIVSISGVVQNPNTYSVSGTTLTFTPAPPTGTSNIAVLYLGLPVVATLSPGNTAYFSSSVFTATASQTVFTPSGTYQVGFINVIRNGSQLAPADYTATNGTTVTLASPCTAGDTVVIEVFNLTSISGALPVTGGTVTGATTFNSTVQINGANVSGFTGFKNRIINGGMNFWQRGTSFTNVATINNFYTADRWGANRNGDASGLTVSQSTDVPAGFKYSAKFQREAGNAATNALAIFNSNESINTLDFAGQSVTLSFYAKVGANWSASNDISVSIRSGTGTDQRVYQFTGLVSQSSTVTITDSWAKYSITKTVPANATEVGAVIQSGAYSGTAGADDSLYITGVQLERGSNATSFEFRDYGRELIMCQRYYEVLLAASGTIGFLSYYFAGSTDNRYTWMFKTTKRASATVSLASGGSWGNSTPSIAGGTDNATFYSTSYFTVNATAATAALQASSEL